MTKTYKKVIVNGSNAVEVRETVEKITIISLEELDRKIAQLQSALTQLEAERVEIAAEQAK